MIDQFEKTKRILEDSVSIGQVFASIKGGKTKRPLIVGQALLNKEESVTDVHIKTLEYTRKFLENFVQKITVHSGANLYVNRMTKESFDTYNECLDSLFQNNQPLVESFFPALGGHLMNGN